VPEAVARHGLVILRGQAVSAREVAASLGPFQRDSSTETGWRHGARGDGRLARFPVAEGGEGVTDVADQRAAHDGLGPWLRERIAVLEWRPSGLPPVILDAESGRWSLLPGEGVIAGPPAGEAAALRDRLDLASTDPVVVLPMPGGRATCWHGTTIGCATARRAWGARGSGRWPGRRRRLRSAS